MSLSAAQQGGAPTWRETRMEMAKRLKDDEKLHLFDGILYPVVICPAENMEALRTLKARSDDVVLLSFPKCGFNWMVSLLRKMLVAVKGKSFSSEMPPQLEFCTPEMQKTIEQEPSPRLLGTHCNMGRLPLLSQSIRDHKTKMLMVFRNPKDTAVSYFHFMNSNPTLPSTQWDMFFLDFLTGNVPFGSYLDHIEDCSKLVDEPNVMTVIYEDLKEQDLAGNLRRIARFLDVPLTEEQLQAISAKSTFSAMKENAVNTHGKFGNVLFRKGEVGDWRNHFSEAQSQQMDEEFNKRLAGTKLGALLQYDTYCK
ncbi:sulfotransferase 6B1-like isoform X1 [Alosa alosa]|uniref:sulfotransferase 6B1-like isoform X1 n=1 Tax=Alosa alosa TaxID=278164 RepID=UPI0020150CE6|nr:sulfotransferase 6B1-like isoform X1 [Alosa alosa]